MTYLETDLVQRSYRVDLVGDTAAEDFTLIERMESELPAHESLLVKLSDLDVSRIEFNSHYGPCIFYTVDADVDTPAHRNRVRALIRKHLKKLRKDAG